MLIAVGLLGAFAAQWLAEREAVNDAATIADVLAEAVVQPAVTDALADGDPAAAGVMDALVRTRVLGDEVTRVKIWSPDGEVLYADEPQLIGRTFPLDEAQREALSDPQTRADVSDLDEAENEFETGGRLLEVYRPVWAPDGRQLLFEVYFPYEPVAARAEGLWRGFAGVTTSSLLLLVVLTAPIVWRLLRGLRTEERRRTALLEHAVDASDAERRRIAGSLHDGPVQELIATTFAAESAAGEAVRRGDEGAAAQLRGVAASVRGNIRVLRSLLVDIYPAGLAAAGLPQALDDLAATTRTRGVDVRVTIAPDLPPLSAEQERLVHRIAQEALRNVAAHAAPCRARVDLRGAPGGDVLLEVSDDGPGFDLAQVTSRPAEGHLGTRVLVDLATEAGAELSVAAAPGRGAAWRLRIPGGRSQGEGSGA
ncbi:Sensor histidine kinase LiaS [Microbacterium lemovicicum]|uniref:Sensor histidine kinase LiaS n=1 Tax=Microbacterium lemovicicum TaxID=1072463 RepID=A0A3S9WF03_9MICO|nr:histidine kinase [Microbacterium lemovicicum]AZS38630.1 Sensor histidine kinase LiaS [Microbacterium lemovicicum]